MTDLLTPEQVADKLNISEVTLKRWRLDGKGPKAVHLSARVIRYRPEQVDEWIDTHRPINDEQRE